MKEVVVPTMARCSRPRPEGVCRVRVQDLPRPRRGEGRVRHAQPRFPKLNFADMSKHKKEDVEWMSTVIKPQMAKLLREPASTPENPKASGACTATRGQ